MHLRSQGGVPSGATKGPFDFPNIDVPGPPGPEAKPHSFTLEELPQNDGANMTHLGPVDKNASLAVTNAADDMADATSSASAQGVYSASSPPNIQDVVAYPQMEPPSRPLVSAASRPSPSVGEHPPTTAYSPRAFAPRDKFVRLAFPDHTTTELKVRWIATAHRLLNIDRDKALIRISSYRSPYVYVARSLPTATIQSMLDGEVITLHMKRLDEPVRKRRLPEYLVTRFPKEVDASAAKTLAGVATVRRINDKNTGAPLNRIYITWDKPEPPPASYRFPGTEANITPPQIVPANPRVVNCYRCWGYGHIAKNCNSTLRCGWCSEEHRSRDCPKTTEVVAEDGSCSAPTSIAEDTHLPKGPVSTKRQRHPEYKCPRCNTPGVTVWHLNCPSTQLASSRSITTAPSAPAESDSTHRPHHTALSGQGHTPLAERLESVEQGIKSLASVVLGLTACLQRFLASSPPSVGSLPGTGAPPQQQVYAGTNAYGLPSSVSPVQSLHTSSDNAHEDTHVPYGELTSALTDPGQHTASAADECPTKVSDRQPAQSVAVEPQAMESNSLGSDDSITTTIPTDNNADDICLRLVQALTSVGQQSLLGHTQGDGLHHLGSFEQDLQNLLQLSLVLDNNIHGHSG